MASPPKKRKNKKPLEIRVDPPGALDYPNFGFDIEHRDPHSKARCGRLTTPNGVIETPNYIFCGTKAAIKGLSPAQVEAAGADIILGNTYHLMIQPGADVIEKMGGLHEFTQWKRPMMTDSGGFQIFSLGHGSVADEVKGRSRKRSNNLQRIDEEGARFLSYRDGKHIFLTPEDSIEIQRQLGADLIYQFDECTAYHHDHAYTGASMERSQRWGDRCLVEFERTDTGRQALYGIVQGGVFPDLRRISCDYVNDRPFFGAAIGGCLGGDEQEIEVIDVCMSMLAEEKPVHLLGIGRIRDVFNFVKRGLDTFDCVIPTRMARHGWALQKGVPNERINLRNAAFRDDSRPLDETMALPASSQFSRAYIHHLLRAGEILGLQILAQHNIAVMTRLMREIRHAIREGTLDALEKEWLPEN